MNNIPWLPVVLVLLVATTLLVYLLKRRKSESSEEPSDTDLSRRKLFGFLSGGALSVIGGWLFSRRAAESAPTISTTPEEKIPTRNAEGMMSLVGTVDPETNGFDPMDMLVDWDYGKTSTLSNGQTLREYNWTAIDKEIEIAPGIKFPAWVYSGENDDGRVPGPTIRCKEGDRIRIHFTNIGSHPHTIHFHGIHPFEMDGVPGAGPGEIAPGESFTYEFDAKPYGCHLYHCHSIPLKRHIHKGLYGAFIVDPPEGRPPANEFMMMMNGFDTNFDGDNEIYAVNTVGHEFMNRKIPVKVGELIRIYLINALEFDAINSLHTHAQFFDFYDHGTSLEPDRETIDTVMMSQAQRGILEFSYDSPGQYMFHAHQSEFAELGWMGKFNVVPPEEFEDALKAADVDRDWVRRAKHGSTA